MKWVVIGALLSVCMGKVFFSEEFDSSWESRWVQTSKSDFGKFVRSAGSWYTNEAVDQGIQTPTNSRSYAISAKFPAFNNKDKDLVIQFTVKNEQHLDCGGGYIKILPEGFDQPNFSGETPYLVMFGPDQCGSERRTHVLVPFNGKNFINNKRFKCESDNLTHLYTLILSPDNTFKFLIDNTEVNSGKIEEYFDILPPKEIDDPSAKKPEDWVDNPTLVDETDVKPDGWDDVPEFVLDESATKPEDWNDETDGEWKQPKKRNTEYRGEWRQKTIPNPDYKGPWVAPKIANPEYKENTELYQIGSAGGVGIEIWQVTAGSVFDNIFVGDNVEEAKEFAVRTWGERKEKESDVKSKRDEEEAAKREAERAQQGVEDEEEEDLSEYEDIEGREDL